MIEQRIVRSRKRERSKGPRKERKKDEYLTLPAFLTTPSLSFVDERGGFDVTTSATTY